MQNPAIPETSTEATKGDAVAMTVPEFARAMGICRATVYVLMKRQEVKSFTVAGRRFIPKSEVSRIVGAAA